MQTLDLAQKRLFTEARSFSHWLPDPVPESLLRAVYELAWRARIVAKEGRALQVRRCLQSAQAEHRRREIDEADESLRD